MKGNFEKLINGDLPVLIDFYATWCGPCKAQLPIIQDVAGDVKGQMRVIKIDIDKNQALCEELAVMSVPTLMIYKEGEQKWIRSGMQTKKKIMDAINKVI